MTSKAFGLAQLGNAFNDGALSNRNKIINGAMVIDQRNAGASVTPSSVAQYTVDRFICIGTQASKLTYQQVTDAPAGFVYSFKSLVASAATPSSSDQFRFGQPIEGINTADFGWGTASAQAATISFRAKASIAGTYSVALWNSANGRSYVTTVSLTTSWASYSFTVPGDTSGTWGAGNGTGIELIFDLGGGSDWVAPANNAWQAGNYFKAAGSISLVSNAAATLNITGVQLEAGDTATPFEHRSYGQELALCQRYYETGITGGSGGLSNGTGYTGGTVIYSATKRASPTLTQSNQGYTQVFNNNIVLGNTGSSAAATAQGFCHHVINGGSATNYVFVYTAVAEL